MIKITDKKNCCGCTACESICPKGCIHMNEDEEGFTYPVVDESVCVNCGACERVCPILNHGERQPFEQVGYVVQNKDSQVLLESTSGGAFTAIAKFVLTRRGVVFGAVLDEDFAVRHIFIENENDLGRFRNSKYVQSDLTGVYCQVKSFLEQGRMVCFSGTPCQIEGLQNYLGEVDDNLVLVDVVCRAVPSPMVFQKYLEYMGKRLGSKVTAVRFRDKHYGYKYSTMNISTDKNNGGYHQGIDSDPWLRAFFSNICDRPSCYDCKFRSRYRVSDFTLWDCLNVDRYSKELDNDRGATRMLIHTKRGEKIFDQIRSDFCCVEDNPDTLVSGVQEMVVSPTVNEKRAFFFADAENMDGSALFEKYFPSNVKVKTEHVVRMVCMKTGIYKAAKRMYVKLTHRYG